MNSSLDYIPIFLKLIIIFSESSCIYEVTSKYLELYQNLWGNKNIRSRGCCGQVVCNLIRETKETHEIIREGSNVQRDANHRVQQQVQSEPGKGEELSEKD